MREILFRGQLRRKGEKVNMAGEPLPSIWKYGGVSQYGGGAMIYQAEPKIEKFPVYGDTVGQYTGLRDKNGTRIFEGDILSAHLDDAFPDEETRGCVCWHDYGWHIKIGVHLDTLESDWVRRFFKIIGNIHDNPELLEGEHNG